MEVTEDEAKKEDLCIWVHFSHDGIVKGWVYLPSTGDVSASKSHRGTRLPVLGMVLRKAGYASFLNPFLGKFASWVGIICEKRRAYCT